MYITNHSVSMQSQYFKLEAASIETNIKNSENNNHSSEKVKKTSIDKSKQELAFNELSAKLTNEILKNINNTTIKSIDKNAIEIISTYNEAQELNFQTKAYIQAGNTNIEIALDVSLSRSFTHQTKIELSTDILKDPLIISLDGNLPMLSSHKFAFDIDSDGSSDQISMLKQNSGFLALDANNNGEIDDGSELFGTKSGDGFRDLATYDDDKNGWIDENDKIFDKLQVWIKNENENKLVGIGELGVGAIYLGSAQTPFELKSENNDLLGEIKKSSFFLFEDGRSGVISQVDLALQSKENLEKAETLNRDVNKLKGNSIYNSQTDNGKKDDEDLVSKLEAMIKKLKSKLDKASSEEKGSLQSQIATLHAQIAALML